MAEDLKAADVGARYAQALFDLAKEQGSIAAVEAEIEDRTFVVVNGMSRNHGTRWDLSDAAELLGYLPVDDAFVAHHSNEV